MRRGLRRVYVEIVSVCGVRLVCRSFIGFIGFGGLGELSGFGGLGGLSELVVDMLIFRLWVLQQYVTCALDFCFLRCVDRRMVWVPVWALIFAGLRYSHPLTRCLNGYPFTLCAEPINLLR